MSHPSQHPTLMSITQRPAPVMIRGNGSQLWDDAGKQYLDFIQGWAVNALGHAAPEVSQALAAQSQRLITPSPAFHNAPQLALADRLTALARMDQAFLCCTGAEANEGAIKLARKWGRLHRDGAFEIITTDGAFHGRTLTTMAASGKPGWDDLFAPRMEGFVKVDFGDAGAIEAAVSPTTAAIMVEPIQGEGGVVVPPSGYLTAIRQIAERHGVLLIFDEVQTGVGRTGLSFAHQAEGVTPDIMTLGKGLGAGVPLAAVLARGAASCFSHGDQGGTHAGNPLMAAVGLAVLDVVTEPDFLRDVRSTGQHLVAGLDAIGARHRGRARGRGLLAALVLEEPNAEAIRDACFDAGALVNAAKPHVLRFMPSLRVTHSEIDHMLAMLEGALAALR